MKNRIFVLLIFFVGMLGSAQKMPVTYNFGEKFSDRYKYSNLLSIAEDGKGGSILVRQYYTGMIIKPKGFLIEHYNENLELVSEYNYKYRTDGFVDAYVKNGQLYMLFLEYNIGTLSYEYLVHRSPIFEYNFTVETILTIASDEVLNPLDKNYYNRDFSKGFTTTALFNKDKSAFVISTHFKKRKVNQHHIYLFNSSAKKVFEHDFSAEVEEKNYAFENIAISKDLSRAYIVGKAYFKKKRFTALERKFQYELIQVSAYGAKTQIFDEPGKFSEALVPVLTNDRLMCVGFYADRKDNRYNGLSYFNIDPINLSIKTKKYSPFSQQFMDDKFGREEEREISNLVFKNVNVTSKNEILFNAEEYFVTSSMQRSPTGTRLKVERYHHNDMVGAKLNANGDVEWIRNINKSEVTQNDGAYASYSSYAFGGDTYFFISTASENPQLVNNERLIFRQGLSRNRNVFLIRLDANGRMDYEKIIDDKEARLPLMVSKALMCQNKNDILFYAKRGTKKQLVKVAF
ncbi:hypothetical protein GGR42_002095 [Saonia flava]|uniref:Uncharacterized protein n=1 Tax=Saonia flava TaxID=523696 RepID=A0A846QZL5_9FLAO|nr:hypothetical protein [Saonia flava]NJB71633.1 hypothetical protein [Saonia flava]